MTTKTLGLIAAALSLVLLSGCHASCKDFCNDAAACAKKQQPGGRQPTSAEIDQCASVCQSSLDKSECKNIHALLDCLDATISKCDQATFKDDFAKCPQCQK